MSEVLAALVVLVAVSAVTTLAVYLASPENRLAKPRPPVARPNYWWYLDPYAKPDQDMTPEEETRFALSADAITVEEFEERIGQLVRMGVEKVGLLPDGSRYRDIWASTPIKDNFGVQLRWDGKRWVGRRSAQRQRTYDEHTGESLERSVNAAVAARQTAKFLAPEEISYDRFLRAVSEALSDLAWRRGATWSPVVDTRMVSPREHQIVVKVKDFKGGAVVTWMSNRIVARGLTIEQAVRLARSCWEDCIEKLADAKALLADQKRNPDVANVSRRAPTLLAERGPEAVYKPLPLEKS